MVGHNAIVNGGILIFAPLHCAPSFYQAALVYVKSRTESYSFMTLFFTLHFMEPFIWRKEAGRCVMKSIYMVYAKKEWQKILLCEQQDFFM